MEPSGRSHRSVDRRRGAVPARARAGEAEVGYDPVDLDSTRYESGARRDPFAAAPFWSLEEARRQNVQNVDREGIVAFFASMGWIADLPDGERLPLLDEVRAGLTADEYWRAWETHVHWTRLRA